MDELAILTSWGFQTAFAAPLKPGEIYARVVEEQKTSYRLITSRGEVNAQLPGRLLKPSIKRIDKPVVGDWVAAQPIWGENKAIVQRVLPRQGLLRRKAAGEEVGTQPLAANVDLTLIVTSLNREFNEMRLQRYLTIVEESGSRAAVLLTKADLSSDISLAETLSEKYKVPCLAVSVINGQGMDAVKALLLPLETAVFVGSSGVGKSTLVNSLLGRESQGTGAIREEDDRGRHTTSSRKLIALPWGALVIDTPGLREIQLDDGQEAGALGFAAIEALALQCKFSNCAHITEPACAVKAALAKGEISEKDFNNYQKLSKKES